MDHTLSSPHRGGRRVRGLIRRWLMPPLIACFVFPAMAAPTPAKSQSASEHDGDLAIVRGILMLPDSEIDLATAKLTIDRLMDPGVDVLGQKLGLDLMLATSPNHVFVKYRDDRGDVFNLEATSGAGFTRDVWMRQQFPMTDEAIASGIYMRPLSKKEAVVVMVGTLLEFYERQGLRELQLKMSRMVLDHNPRDVAILLHQHAAWLWFRNLLVNRYVTPDEVPAAERALLARHDTALRDLYERAWSLGWRPPDEAQDEAVRQRAATAKATQLEESK